MSSAHTEIGAAGILGVLAGEDVNTILDTEFTDLLAPQLLSIRLVTLDGREHYAEIDLATAA